MGFLCKWWGKARTTAEKKIRRVCHYISDLCIAGLARKAMFVMDQMYISKNSLDQGLQDDIEESAGASNFPQPVQHIEPYFLKQGSKKYTKYCKGFAPKWSPFSKKCRFEKI